MTTDPTLVTKPCGHTVGWCSHGTLSEQLSRIPDRYLSRFYRRIQPRGLRYPPTGGLDFLDLPSITYSDGTTLSEHLDAQIDARG
jgi:hypothetical protein